MIVHMPTHREQKAKNAGISLYPWEIEKQRAFAAENSGGNVSAIIRRGLAAIGCDLDAEATAAPPAGPVVNLAQRHAPDEARALAECLTDTTRPRRSRDPSTNEDPAPVRHRVPRE
ncbi:MAG: hypothetical protein QG602_2943 [Verrucomicrobiota bacterium]|nr:hypothetical protein [Verrucomicrobiota bacterium]